jgi:hypothetical protein
MLRVFWRCAEHHLIYTPRSAGCFLAVCFGNAVISFRGRALITNLTAFIAKLVVSTSKCLLDYLLTNFGAEYDTIVADRRC